jgi:hypothetical protein
MQGHSPQLPTKRTVETSEQKDEIFRYRKRSIVLLSTYITVLLVPWILTCILMFRPISKPSYINQAGNYSAADIEDMERWYSAVDILNKIAATVAVPATSALLAQAAVVYTQRRKSGQHLSVHQMAALADRGWASLPTLWEASGNFDTASASSTSFLWFAAALTLLGKPIVWPGYIGLHIDNTSRQLPFNQHCSLCSFSEAQRLS